VRILIVDNYDSFTYNLFHYLAEIPGVEPTVIRNDEPDWDPHRLSEFAGVVLSPGPGRPERPRDFGLCRDIVRHAALPVLGVCLGHQGLCHLFGGRVDTAPEPRHGRLSPVRHDGSELFSGIPSPFSVVRYHSLAVTDLPADLRAAAWSEDDGVLMAVRHRERPLWGVQFHPESICTEHGHQLLTNFTDLARQWSAANGRPTGGDGAHRPRAASSPEAPAARVLVRRLPLRVSAEAAFDTLYGRSADAFWLDSSRVDGQFGRSSILGDASGPLARVARADVASGRVTVTARGQRTELSTGFLDWLDSDLRRWQVTRPADLPIDFALGWVGYLGYELKAECGANLVHPSPAPDAWMVFADRAVVIDHGSDEVYLLALEVDGAAPGADEWFAATERTLRDLPAADPPLFVPPHNPRRPVRQRHDRQRYLELVNACQEEIHAGESYEVCLTNMFTLPAAVDAWQCYRRLRRLNPAPFAALLRMGEASVLSSSPERFVRVGTDGWVESKPIKGTRPRGATAEEDRRLHHDLAGSEKDRAENLMIVDLVRNDLARTTEVGSVHVPRLFDVETYRTVHQLVSTVRAKLRPQHTAVECVRAAFPGGSMTGAPKLRTMEIIDRLEAGHRGVYSGALGYFSLTGAADLSIVIRTAVVLPDRVEVGAGGAIIALSDPAAEYDETLVKARAVLQAFDAELPAARPDTAAPTRSGQPAADRVAAGRDTVAPQVNRR
jgi:para-aminobenzoate synthetase